MRRCVAIALSALVVLAVPAIVIGNSLWVLMNPWLVHAEYALPGFPDDAEGLDNDERTELAVTGVRSIRPGGEGIELLREARLPDGEEAFEQREIVHMEDVRGVIAGFVWAWAIALAALAASIPALRRIGEREVVPTALSWGALLSGAAILLAGLVMLVSFDLFFESFHGLFFEGDSWRFNETYTLRSLYPDAFWGIAGGAVAALVVLQAVAIQLLARRLGAPPLGRALPGRWAP